MSIHVGRFWIGLFILILLTGAVDAANGALPTSTVLIWVEREGGLSQGAGCLVDRDEQLVVTSAHLVQEQRKLIVAFPQLRDGKVVSDPLPYHERRKRGQLIHAQVCVIDARRDLAVLRLPAVAKDAPQMKLAPVSAEPGAKVILYGHPFSRNSMWQAIAGAVRSVDGMKWSYPRSQQVNARVVTVLARESADSGFSGGPVLDERHQLVGVISAAGEEGQPIYGIDVRDVRHLLAATYVSLGNDSLRQDKRACARARFAKAVHLDPQAASAWCGSGKLHFLEGQWDEAQADFARALRIAPYDWTPHCYRGLLLLIRVRLDWSRSHGQVRGIPIIMKAD
jgi:hypothetical protein